MECPKCHSKMEDNQAVCNICHKVILLECPNCGELSDTAVCEKCGYSILVKCAKCSKINNIKTQTCKCGFPTNISLAYQECECDEFAFVTITFPELKKMGISTKTKELYAKLKYRIGNIVLANIKGTDGKFISFDNEYVLNFNKELSFPTSANKAVRFALKFADAFNKINQNLAEEFECPLTLVITISKKNAKDLQTPPETKNTVKPLTINKKRNRTKKEVSIILDEFVRDEVCKTYRTDSLFITENNGKAVMFYELLTQKFDQSVIKKTHTGNILPQTGDMYSYKLFDIKAKCSFRKANAQNIYSKLDTLDFDKQNKITSILSEPQNRPDIGEITNYFLKLGYKVLNINCTKELNYKPWGFMEEILREYYNLPVYGFFDSEERVPQEDFYKFKILFDLLKLKTSKALTPEDARYHYIEKWNQFLNRLNKTVIITDGFENIDDTSLLTLDIYLDKLKKIKPIFLFITSPETSVHSKIKKLVRSSVYTEFTLLETTLDECLSTIKSDACNFINSKRFEELKSNFDGSYLYFKHAISFYKRNGVLSDQRGKLTVNENTPITLPKGLKNLYKSEMKLPDKETDLSFIAGYALLFGGKIDFKTLENLAVKNPEEKVKSLSNYQLGFIKNNRFYLADFPAIYNVLQELMNKNAEDFLVKKVIAKIGKNLDDTTKALLFGRLGDFKNEYLTLWKNSQLAIKSGDFDAYLKNCLGYLSIAEHINANIEENIVKENKKEVYNNILAYLYRCSPSKIYFIENYLLMDAIEEGNDEKIVKLSNLMLQGALLSANYTDAPGLLHNIISRLDNPNLITDGKLNTKYLLLSLINIEILYKTGDFAKCVSSAKKILKVLTPELIDKAKPANFSKGMFRTHVTEIMGLASLAKLSLADDELEKFFNRIKKALNADPPDKDSIVAIKQFLAGKPYKTENIEEYPPFSKIIFLILQEVSLLKGDYKRFARNIYQAKLLASDIGQNELEKFCDLLIAFAYKKEGITAKAETICKDVLKTAEKEALFNIIAISKYILALLDIDTNKPEAGLIKINEILKMISEYDNQAKILYALCKKLQSDILISQNPEFTPNEDEITAPLKDRLKLILNP